MKKTIQSCFTILLTVCLFFHHAPIRSLAQTPSESGENSLAPVIQQTEPREYNAKGELVGEDTSKRERNIKHFFKDDFSYEAVLYPTSVHVKENGAWVDIDNSLTEQNVKGEQVYKNKKNSFSVLFAKTATSKKLVQLSQGSYEISFSLLDAQSSLSQVALPLEVERLSASESLKVLRNLSSVITYDEVFKGVSLRYTVLPERLKEDIILTSADAIQDFRFIYQTKNLSMEEFEGQVVFKDTETGKEVFFLEPPHMMDSAGEISTDITMQ